MMVSKKLDIFFFQGLVTLEKDFTLQIRKDKNIVEEQVQCNSAEAIPLHYEPLQKSAPPHNEEDPALHDIEHLQLAESELSSSWHRLSKVLLLRKAAITFYSLAKNNFSIKKFGCSLRYIKSALMCFGKQRAETLLVTSQIYFISHTTKLTFYPRNKYSKASLQWPSLTLPPLYLLQYFEDLKFTFIFYTCKSPLIYHQPPL